MKVAFDTSVLVAALVSAHPSHTLAIPWLKRARRKEFHGVANVHAMSETYAVLTRLPLGPRPSPAQVWETLRAIEGLEWTPAEPALYREAIGRCAERGLRSGAVFDALHLVAAERAQADRLLTFNIADFERLQRAHEPELVVPGEEVP